MAGDSFTFFFYMHKRIQVNVVITSIRNLTVLLRFAGLRQRLQSLLIFWCRVILAVQAVSHILLNKPRGFSPQTNCTG
jgi:hypothetical protein